MYWTWELKTAIILLILQTCKAAKPEKNTGPAVFEVINEQARTDDKKVLPYENPLAGNSRQNAKLHAQHQQAMFNAERVRQHRAQLLRWNNQHPKQQVDSYMKAYQESQENHQLALEKMQTNSKEKKTRGRSGQARTLKDKEQLEPAKITRSDAVNKNRNHRSFGSLHATHHNKFKIHTYPELTYDQGVTMKPNGNLGLHNYAKRHTTLYTEAIPSKSHFIYPKLYSQAYAYQTANDISSLSSLLSQTPQEQLTKLNTLISSPKETESNHDLYYYLKNSQLSNKASSLASVGSNSGGHLIQKDFTPITEEVDDIEDNRDPRIKFIQPAPALSQVGDNAITTESSYYKIESEQTVKNDAPKNTQYFPQDELNYEALKHETPLHFYLNEPSTEGVKYLKSQPTGVQHLTQDGTGVSAYGDDDVSIKKHRTKRELNTEYFVFGNSTSTTEKLQPVFNETLINLEMNCTLNVYNITLSDLQNETLPTPEELKRSRYLPTDNGFNIGEAYDYDYTYDENESNGNSKFDYSDESDYDYESSIPDYDYEVPRQRPRPIRPRRPGTNQNLDNRGSFSNRFSKFRHSNFDDYHPESVNRDFGDQFDSLHYGTGHQFGLPTTSYGAPIHYSPPAIQTPTSFPTISHGLNPVSQVSGVINSLQPVYMLTQSQIKNLLSNQKLNIEHLDVFQLPHDSFSKSRRPKFPRQQKPRYRRFPKSGRKYKLGRLRKLNKFVKF